MRPSLRLPSGTQQRFGQVVAFADGTMSTFTFNKYAVSLQQQNDLREAMGLPPLPDPSTITHEQPATATPSRSAQP